MNKIIKILLNLSFATVSHTTEINCDLSHVPQGEKAPHILEASLEDLKKHGFVVHVGGISLTYIDKSRNISFQRPTVVASGVVTYWSFCSPTTAETFYFKSNLFSTNAIIIKPIRNCLERIVSVCSSEIIMAGHVPLEAGDIVIFPHRPIQKAHRYLKYASTNQPGHLKVSATLYDGSEPITDRIYTEQEYRDYFFTNPDVSSDALKSFGIIPVTYDPVSHFHLDRNEINQQQEIARRVLERIGSWQVTSVLEGWWTHQTLIKVKDQVIEPQSFFKNLFSKYPYISYGYEFYAKSGISSHFRLLQELINPEESEIFSKVFIHHQPKIYKLAFDFVRGTLRSYFENAEHLSESVKEEALSFCNNVEQKEFSAENISTTSEITDELLNKTTLKEVFVFCSHLNKELFATFINSIQQHLDENIYSKINTAYQLLDNYKNSEDHTSTLELKTKLLDVSDIDFLRDVYIYATGFDFINSQEDSISPTTVMDWFKHTN